MARILFFVALVFAVWFVVRLLGRSRGPDAGRPPPAPPRPVEGMAQCAYCGAHVPTSDAVAIADGRTYCSSAHRDAAEGGAR